MQFFGHIIVRLVWIAIGVGLALVAASIFLSAGLLGGAFELQPRGHEKQRGGVEHAAEHEVEDLGHRASIRPSRS